MYTKQEIIIRSYRGGKSQRQISRELQISRWTVKKYIKESESHKREGKNSGAALSVYLTSRPVYSIGTRSKVRLTKEVQASIDKLLEENRRKVQQGLRKQILKKVVEYIAFFGL